MFGAIAPGSAVGMPVAVVDSDPPVDVGFGSTTIVVGNHGLEFVNVVTGAILVTPS